MGNTVIEDANGKVVKVIAQQAINVDFMNKLDVASSDPNANGLLHEISEAYIGATNSFESGFSAAPGRESDLKNLNSAYGQAHFAAYAQPDIITYKLSPNHYYTTQYAPSRITISPNSPDFIKDQYINGRRLVRFFTR